jgi:hypothetical protein
MNIPQAQMKIAEIVQQRRVAGKPADYMQVDAVLCEDGKQVIAYLYFMGDLEASTFVSIDLPAPVDAAAFDPAAFEEVLMAGGTVH